MAIREGQGAGEAEETMLCRLGVARAMKEQGRHEEAEKEFRAVLAIRERTLGPKNANTLSSYRELALCLQTQGKREEALELARHALSVSLQRWGSSNDFTGACQKIVSELSKP